MNHYKAKCLERMEQERIEQNTLTRLEIKCIVCNNTVPEQDFDTKFMQAGGFLHGPFCSRECYFEELI